MNTLDAFKIAGTIIAGGFALCWLGRLFGRLAYRTFIGRNQFRVVFHEGKYFPQILTWHGWQMILPEYQPACGSLTMAHSVIRHVLANQAATEGQPVMAIRYKGSVWVNKQHIDRYVTSGPPALEHVVAAEPALQPQPVPRRRPALADVPINEIATALAEPRAVAEPVPTDERPRPVVVPRPSRARRFLHEALSRRVKNSQAGMAVDSEPTTVAITTEARNAMGAAVGMPQVHGE